MAKDRSLQSSKKRKRQQVETNKSQRPAEEVKITRRKHSKVSKLTVRGSISYNGASCSETALETHFEIKESRID